MFLKSQQDFYAFLLSLEALVINELESLVLIISFFILLLFFYFFLSLFVASLLDFQYFLIL